MKSLHDALGEHRKARRRSRRGLIPFTALIAKGRQLELIAIETAHRCQARDKKKWLSTNNEIRVYRGTHEVIFFNRILSTDEREIVRNYVLKK